MWRLDSSFAMILFQFTARLFFLYLHRNSLEELPITDDLTSDYESECPKSKSRTHGLLNRHFVLID